MANKWQTDRHTLTRVNQQHNACICISSTVSIKSNMLLKTNYFSPNLPAKTRQQKRREKSPTKRTTWRNINQKGTAITRKCLNCAKISHYTRNAETFFCCIMNRNRCGRAHFLLYCSRFFLVGLFICVSTY